MNSYSALQPARTRQQSSLQLRAAAELERRRRVGGIAVLLTFAQFVKQVHPYRQWPDYAYQLFAVLQQVANGELDRVMVFMPPRHFKSEIVSRLFSAYYLYRYPDRWVGLCSYAAALSYTLSRNARDNYQKQGGTLKEDASAVSHWETGKDGGLWAAGVGGAITGKGFHLGIIDDPIKNSEEAQSSVIQRRNDDWYDSTFSTRQEPGAAIVLIQTRWGLHDAAGYLLEKEKEQPENWHILNFEAIKEQGPPNFPDTCILEPDNRQVGEALNPSRYSIDKLGKIKGRIGTYFFNALYQQNPSLRTGRVYHAYTRPGPDASTLDYSKAVGWWHAHDFGAVNEVWGLFVKIEGKYYLVYEQMLPEATTASRAGMIKEATQSFLGESTWREKVVAGYGGAKSEKQQRIDYRSAGVDIRLPDVNDVESQIDTANKMLEAGELVICSNCVHTIDHLEHCIRDSQGKILNESAFHYASMLRYFCAGVGSGLHWAR